MQLRNFQRRSLTKSSLRWNCVSKRILPFKTAVLLTFQSILNYFPFLSRKEMDLTLEEQNIIRSLWDTVLERQPEFGRLLFKKLFAETPSIQDKFVFAKGLSWEEIESKPARIDAHAAAVFKSITSLVENMESPDAMKDILHKLGASHKPRGITVKYLETLGDVLIQTSIEIFGKVPGSETQNAWNKFYSILICEMGGKL